MISSADFPETELHEAALAQQGRPFEFQGINNSIRNSPGWDSVVDGGTGKHRIVVEAR